MDQSSISVAEREEEKEKEKKSTTHTHKFYSHTDSCYSRDLVLWTKIQLLSPLDDFVSLFL